jgi:hypothetical protein
MVIARDESEKHKEVYFDSLKAGRFGVNFIEDGLLYERVRLCRTEPGSPDECEAK